jgi:hypothetical protein
MDVFCLPFQPLSGIPSLCGISAARESRNNDVPKRSRSREAWLLCWFESSSRFYVEEENCLHKLIGFILRNWLVQAYKQYSIRGGKQIISSQAAWRLTSFLYPCQA